MSHELKASNRLEYFAGQALAGIMANPAYFNNPPERIVADALRVARDLDSAIADTPAVVRSVRRFTIRDANDVTAVLEIPDRVGCEVEIFGRLTGYRLGVLSITLADRTICELDTTLDPLIRPHLRLAHVKVHALVVSDRPNTKYEIISIEKDESSQVPSTVSEAIILVKLGRIGEFLTSEDEDVFAAEREECGDNRAAFHAFVNSFVRAGLTKEEVVDELSTNQIEEIGELVKNYIFAKYDRGS